MWCFKGELYYISKFHNSLVAKSTEMMDQLIKFIVISNVLNKQQRLLTCYHATNADFITFFSATYTLKWSFCIPRAKILGFTWHSVKKKKKKRRHIDLYLSPVSFMYNLRIIWYLFCFDLNISVGIV